MLPSFSIRNFRAFDALDLPRLGPVNLVVGRNNVGKTMLLEALRVHRARGAPTTLLGLLGVHDEFLRERAEESQFPPVDVASVFHGWNTAVPAILGPLDDPEQRLVLEIAGAGTKPSAADDDERPSQQRLSIAYGGELVGWVQLDESFGYLRTSQTLSGPAYHAAVRRSGQYAHLGSPFVGPRSITDETIARWWDATSLTDAEQRVIESLRIISPVERVSLVAHPLGAQRMVQVLLEGESRPLPLRHLGDGMARIFALALALENARESGQLLIDELENGIHYTGLPKLWHFVFEAAARYGVQVFATTHSWDCVQAFQEAAAHHRQTDGTLVKLFDEEGRICSATLSEDELAIVARDGIEVR
jgi:hypothetical protein